MASHYLQVCIYDSKGYRHYGSACMEFCKQEDFPGKEVKVNSLAYGLNGYIIV